MTQPNDLARCECPKCECVNIGPLCGYCIGGVHGKRRAKKCETCGLKFEPAIQSRYGCALCEEFARNAKFPCDDDHCKCSPASEPEAPTAPHTPQAVQPNDLSAVVAELRIAIAAFDAAEKVWIEARNSNASHREVGRLYDAWEHARLRLHYLAGTNAPALLDAVEAMQREEAKRTSRSRAATHSDECWKWHHDCANAYVLDLKQRLAELERQVPRCCVAEDAVTADQIDNGYGYGESMRITCELHPAPPAEQTGCKRCGKPLAYDGAIYCGAACSAISEQKEGTGE